MTCIIVEEGHIAEGGGSRINRERGPDKTARTGNRSAWWQSAIWRFCWIAAPLWKRQTIDDDSGFRGSFSRDLAFRPETQRFLFVYISLFSLSLSLSLLLLFFFIYTTLPRVVEMVSLEFRFFFRGGEILRVVWRKNKDW